jgi:hypothetical protein
MKGLVENCCQGCRGQQSGIVEHACRPKHRFPAPCGDHTRQDQQENDKVSFHMGVVWMTKDSDQHDRMQSQFHFTSNFLPISFG